VKDADTQKIVRSDFDLGNPPPSSAEDLLVLERLKAMPDDEIDTSDIPELTDEFFENAVTGMFRVRKEQLTIRLDVDVLAWLKSHGRGWQTSLNFYLRQAMQREQRRRRTEAKADKP
jgi:uncharacterized protein (DUF4415 family)